MSLAPTGAAAISFAVLHQLDAWTGVPAGQDFAGSERALFEVRFLVQRGQAYPTSLVTGTVAFYARADTADIADQSEIHYTFMGMVDLTGNKARSEDTNWGNLLALYYPPEE